MTESTPTDPIAEQPVQFGQFGLHPGIMKAIEATGYVSATPIQAKAIPIALTGRDVMGAAQTGTGKTAAFSLPILHRLMPFASNSASPARHPVRALILTPTRELADQIHENVQRYSQFVPLRAAVVFGGVDIRPQRDQLRQGCEILIATPGRLLDHVEQRNVNLGQVGILVLDEADRMLDMGFSDAIDDIVGRIAKHHQTLLFSATYPDAIRAASKRLQHDPVEVTVEAPATAEAAIEQRFIEVEPAHKVDTLAQLLAGERGQQVLVFCNMRRDVDAVAQELDRRGFSALPLHGDMEQRDRDEVLVRFANHSCSILVATDVAARGLDIAALPLVLSYDIAHDPDTHTHRIGRTGRAGQAGLAITLCTPRERPKAANIEEAQDSPLPWRPLKLAPPRGKTLNLAPMKTLVIDAGRQDKLRPGDILGALTGDAGLDAKDIGKIDVFATRAYVAITRALANKALERLRAGRIKGRNFRVRALG